MILELIRFKRIADLGTITRASETLWLTQPALTQSMHRLEQELDFKLFKPSGKRIFLTERGKIVYEISRRIIEWWEKAKNLKDPTNFPPSYSIGVFDNAALQLSEYFQKKIKNTKLEIDIDRSENLLRKLQYGLLDICICVLPKDVSLFTNVWLIKTYKEKLIPVSGNIWKEPISKIPFILYNHDSQTQQYVNEAFSKSEIKPNVVAESINPLFMKELAIKNFGVALLPENMVDKDIQEKRLFVQKLPISFERICGIFLNKEHITKDVEKIVREIITYLPNLPK
ncbi:MAG: LysR family transcriptional regulator [Candidatus Levybacteria bacterium]|nr:LysR family transcriptional regulator [Candidatus Levybacteria bacterium]